MCPTIDVGTLVIEQSCPAGPSFIGFRQARGRGMAFLMPSSGVCNGGEIPQNSGTNAPLHFMGRSARSSGICGYHRVGLWPGRSPAGRCRTGSKGDAGSLKLPGSNPVSLGMALLSRSSKRGSACVLEGLSAPVPGFVPGDFRAREDKLSSAQQQNRQSASAIKRSMRKPDTRLAQRTSSRAMRLIRVNTSS